MVDGRREEKNTTEECQMGKTLTASQRGEREEFAMWQRKFVAGIQSGAAGEKQSHLNHITRDV